MIDRTNRLVLAALFGLLLGSGFVLLATDGPLTPIGNLRGRTDENGYLITKVGGGVSATEYTEGGAFSSASAGSLGLLVRRDTPSAGTGVADGDLGVPSMDSGGRALTRSMFVDSSNVELTFAADGTEDVAETGGVTGPVGLTVRRDTAASSAGTTGDYATQNTDQLGRTWTRFGDPCADYARVQSAKIDTASSGNVEIVALAASQIVYVCGYDFIATTAVSVQLIYGTGTACATGETDLTGPYPAGANGGIAIPNTGAVQLKTASANALCIELSGTVQVSGVVKYVQTAAP